MAAEYGEYEEDIFGNRYEDEEAENIYVNGNDDEEGINEVKRQQYITEAAEEGLSDFNQWESTFASAMKSVISENEIKPAFEALKRASRATCLVRRGKGSQERSAYHEQMANKFLDLDEKKCTYHKERVEQKGGLGTGVLICPKLPNDGWLVITNNHVIMNEEEALSATVYFDYTDDALVSRNQTLSNVDPSIIKMFTVKELISFSKRTDDSSDKTTLDYSLLLLSSEKGDNKFLSERAVHFDESDRTRSSIEIKPELPFFMFSHPHGLAKRLSLGTVTSVSKDPVRHITHDLGSINGCSGGNLLFSSVDDTGFQYWQSVFLHYRHGHAVSWEAIAPDMREKIKPYTEKIRIYSD